MSSDVPCQLIQKLKSQGIFDRIRKKILEELESTPQYEDLMVDADAFTNNFLRNQNWPPALSKIELREELKYKLDNEVIRAKLGRAVSRAIDSQKLQQSHIEQVVQEYCRAKSPAVSSVVQRSVHRFSPDSDVEMDIDSDYKQSPSQPTAEVDSPGRNLFKETSPFLQRQASSTTLYGTLTESARRNQTKRSARKSRSPPSARKNDYLRGSSHFDSGRGHASRYSEEANSSRGKTNDRNRDYNYSRKHRNGGSSSYHQNLSQRSNNKSSHNNSRYSSSGRRSSQRGASSDSENDSQRRPKSHQVSNPSNDQTNRRKEIEARLKALEDVERKMLNKNTGSIPMKGLSHGLMDEACFNEKNSPTQQRDEDAYDPEFF